ncbi:MAG: hypothetical protein WKF85_13015 [Chitinophagaceae bacterium]
MYSKLSHIICLIVIVCLFSISSCKKTDLVEPEAKKVFISNLIQLYAGINDPTNEGSTLVLAPGTYRLNPDFPNAGRLELRHNMSLIGQSGNASAVVIDVSGLPGTSYVVAPTPTYPLELRTAPIRIGNGYNAIEWITFTNDPSNIIRAMIMTDIVAKQNASDPAPLAQVRIAHTIIKNSSIGLNILNRDAVSDGRVLEAEIENNEILENTQPQFGSGVQIQNSQGVIGALIKVNLRGNYIHGNMQGLNLFNTSSGGNNRIIGRSISDRLEDNGLGLLLTAGLNVAGGAERVTGNSINFEADGTSIRNNGNLPAPLTNSFALNNYIVGGVFINGGNVGKIGNSRGVPGTVGSNTVEAVLKDCRIENNLGSSQINVFGAYSNLTPIPAGSYNNALLTLIGISKNASVNAVTSFPFEPAVTNTVTVK